MSNYYSKTVTQKDAQKNFQVFPNENARDSGVGSDDNNEKKDAETE